MTAKTTDVTPTEDTTSTTAAATTDALPKSELSTVKYTGLARVRGLSASDLEKVGVEQKTDLEWNAENQYTVDVKDVSAKTLEYLRSQHADEFSIS